MTKKDKRVLAWVLSLSMVFFLWTLWMGIQDINPSGNKKKTVKPSSKTQEVVEQKIQSDQEFVERRMEELEIEFKQGELNLRKKSQLQIGLLVNGFGPAYIQV